MLSPLQPQGLALDTLVNQNVSKATSGGISTAPHTCIFCIFTCGLFGRHRTVCTQSARKSLASENLQTGFHIFHDLSSVQGAQDRKCRNHLRTTLACGHPAGPGCSPGRCLAAKAKVFSGKWSKSYMAQPLDVPGKSWISFFQDHHKKNITIEVSDHLVSNLLGQNTPFGDGRLGQSCNLAILQAL